MEVCVISQILRNLEYILIKFSFIGQGKHFLVGGGVVGIVLSINEGETFHFLSYIILIFFIILFLFIFFNNIGHWSFGASFYKKQLTLDYLLATSTKPLMRLYIHIHVSLINGIVMGGGAGLSMNSMFRVVTENTIFIYPFLLFFNTSLINIIL
ncbi:hypothetical protein AAG906_004798 [Vitis piasezkii]